MVFPIIALVRQYRHVKVIAISAMAAVALMIGFHGWGIKDQRRSGSIVLTSSSGNDSFSEPRLSSLRASGKPVFLYFTADWCLTCKVNEKAAIERDEVASAFKAKGVLTMVGDWTNGDPEISRFLEAQGRSGVPLYLYYKPGAATPQVLPQILTTDSLIALTR
jgi:thiol:disulfide interchange protein